MILNNPPKPEERLFLISSLLMIAKKQTAAIF
jgi:hypothetical protein